MISGTFVAARIALSCLVAYGCSPQSKNHPACVTLDGAVKWVHAVTQEDWQRLDRTTLETSWPQLPVFDVHRTSPGLTAVAEDMTRCCKACEACGGAVLTEEPNSARLEQAELWMCRRSRQAVGEALQRLRDAVVVPGTRPASSHSADDRLIESYSWVSHGALFTLQARAVASDTAWIGGFRLARCRPDEVIETWQVGGDAVVSVLLADLQPPTGDAPILQFAYVTVCLAEDRACREKELDRLWPTLRSLADREKVAAIDLSAEDCIGESVSFRLSRSPSGGWEVGIWTPKQ